MPTYEYRCPKGHTFEKFQKMTDKPSASCPTCKKAATRLISGGAGLVFKGSGFYITDYGKDGKGPRKEGSAEAKAPVTPAADTKAVKDSAPAKPAPAKPAKASE